MKTFPIVLVLYLAAGLLSARGQDTSRLEKIYQAQVLCASDFPKDSLDFVMDQNAVDAFLTGKEIQALFHPMSKEELHSCRRILDELLASDEPRPLCGKAGLPSRDYFKQYYAYKKRGKVFVHVKLYHCIPALVPIVPCWEEMKHWAFRKMGVPLPEVLDGGTDVGDCLIDLKKGKVSVIFNGES